MPVLAKILEQSPIRLTSVVRTLISIHTINPYQTMRTKVAIFTYRQPRSPFGSMCRRSRHSYSGYLVCCSWGFVGLFLVAVKRERAGRLGQRFYSVVI